ncbi:uncharacterized protein LOC144132655 isoform X6 [Amblyomma americanum]
MLAYVKYEYKARAILPVNLIKLFEPESIDDFDPRKQVNAFWCSEDRSIFGYYPAFVHALADDLELMHSKLKSFRDPFLRVIDVDLQCSKEPVGKRRKMPSSKGKKKYRAEAVDLVNEAIIEQCGTELEQNEEVRQKTAELQDALHRKEKELKRLRKELREANELNQRLTSALLDKIEVARATTQPEGTVIAEVVMASCLDADSGLPKEMLCDAPSSAGDSHGNETADQPLEEGHKEMIEKPVALFEAVDGQIAWLISSINILCRNCRRTTEWLLCGSTCAASLRRQPAKARGCGVLHDLVTPKPMNCSNTQTSELTLAARQRGCNRINTQLPFNLTLYALTANMA